MNQQDDCWHRNDFDDSKLIREHDYKPHEKQVHEENLFVVEFHGSFSEFSYSKLAEENIAKGVESNEGDDENCKKNDRMIEMIEEFCVMFWGREKSVIIGNHELGSAASE